MTALKRNPEVSITEIEGEFFLVEPENGDIFYLDQIASAIWRFFEEAGSLQEALDTLIAAFPDADPQEVSQDAERVIGELEEGKLLISAD